MTHQIASGMPKARSTSFTTVDHISWLSTQVYTPFSRNAGRHEIFLVFSQVRVPIAARSFVKFAKAWKISAISYTLAIEITDVIPAQPVEFAKFASLPAVNLITSGAGGSVTTVPLDPPKQNLRIWP